jgi:hypothetical protein
MLRAIRVLFVGAAAGYLAGQAMDRATTWFYERQSDASKQRENELLPDGAPIRGGGGAGPRRGAPAHRRRRHRGGRVRAG